MKNRTELTDVTGLLGHLADTMINLSTKNITIDEAKAQASLVKQSNNLLRFDLDRQKFEKTLKDETFNNDSTN